MPRSFRSRVLNPSREALRSAPFKGVIKLDVRDSKPDWTPYELKKAPAGAPNILIVLYDDTGLAAWSPFGGRINMPTLQKLADNGLRYSQWHTTALCSPTRSTFLTGRNHHVNRCASITEATDGFPGAAETVVHVVLSRARLGRTVRMTYEEARVRNRVDCARTHNNDRGNHEHDQGMLDERSL
jgi:sulfatase-like protein